MLQLSTIAVGEYVIREAAEQIPNFSKDDKLVLLIDDTELPSKAKLLGGRGCYKLVSEVLA